MSHKTTNTKLPQTVLVQDLIDALQKYDPNMEVFLVWTERPDVLLEPKALECEQYFGTKNHYLTLVGK